MTVDYGGIPVFGWRKLIPLRIITPSEKYCQLMEGTTPVIRRDESNPLQILLL